MKKIKFHYFEVLEKDNTNLDEICTHAQKLALPERLKNISNTDVRLDEIRKDEADSDLWLMKFCRIRKENYPSITTPSSVATDLILEDGEYLSEETFAIYSIKKNCFVIQYNHFAVRPNKIIEYFNVIAAGLNLKKYQLMPILTNDILEKYRNKKIVTSIDVVVEGVNSADLLIAQDQSLTEALKVSIGANASRMQLQLSVDARDKTNKLEYSLIERIKNFIQERDQAKDSLKITAKENPDDTCEVLDLISERKVSEYDASSISLTLGNRYGDADLYRLLLQTMRDWK